MGDESSEDVGDNEDMIRSERMRRYEEEKQEVYSSRAPAATLVPNWSDLSVTTPAERYQTCDIDFQPPLN